LRGDWPVNIIKPGVTEEEFYRLADEDSNWEYLEGKIYMHSPASRSHEEIFGFLLTLFKTYVGEKGGASVFGSRYPMRLDAEWSPEPEVLVVRHERRHLLKSKYLDGPADLVIEVVSESDPGLDYRVKLPRYRQAAIPEIWIVDPFKRSVLVESLGENGYSSRVVSCGRLESAVLAGFWIDVSWLWEEAHPAPLSCIREILG
jgi:Uma2 family endonuclease